MKTWKYILAALAALSLAACGGEESEPVRLSATPSSLVFTGEGGTQEVTITTDVKPTVSCNDSWISFKEGSLSNNTFKLSVTAQENDGAEERNTYIRVIGNKMSLMISVSQGAPSIKIVKTTAITPEEVFRAMAPGWNLGNQMDAIWNHVANETIWGNPECTQATMNGVKAAGFKAVRICVTWQGHIGPAPTYQVDAKWLDRVAEIVGYAEKAGLVAIVNSHHDETEWQDIAKAYTNTVQNENVKEELFCLWKQIAQRFADKGEWLVFESLNEIQDGGWGWSQAFRADPQAQYKVLNEWNQTFVDAVRSTGGNNATRWLGVPGYAANPAFTIEGLVLPQDYTTENRLMVAVHDYDPYDYTLNKDTFKTKYQWGHTADPAHRVSNDDEGAVVAVFDNLKAAYIDKGIPVYIGEMGCSRHEEKDLPYQRYYMEYFCKAAADRLLPMYLWDNGGEGSGSETHAYINHGTGAFVNQESETLVGLMVKAVTTTDPAYTLESVYHSAP